jgi:16S rRNA (guanine527-N7)-methyltransferase
VSQQLASFSSLWFDSLSWQPTEIQQSLFEKLYEKVLAANAGLNLTRITEPEEFWEKHLWDSLSAIRHFIDTYPQRLKANFKVIDVGTGGGFPGVPVAIVQPDWLVYLLDSTQKKITFVERLTVELELTNTRTIVGRAEAIAQNKPHREAYDLVLIRAVANANVCAEYVLPLLKLGGTAILYRGQWTPEETRSLEGALEQLGGKIGEIKPLTTPLTGGIRHCIYLTKFARTPPNFPRAVGIPNQQPL